ncbi:hypothetical protein KKD19_04590 [Patescibacteria group bacterium]|nr:hypothetical protein [Patescibacteria group bacterium]MBU4512486.1 hypothetical protein [Patescibacteria group bacterium]MCG2692808.1 hypothetical protein [Candidatus Parcubacteria bacterium]
MKKIVFLLIVLSLGIAVAGCGLLKTASDLSNQAAAPVEEEEITEPEQKEEEEPTDTSDLDQLLQEADDADKEADEAMDELDSIDETEDEPLEF